jgi:hypothetical protein
MYMFLRGIYMSELTYWKNPATGLIEGVDILGTVKVVQKNPNLQFSSKPGGGFEERFSAAVGCERHTSAFVVLYKAHFFT